MAAEKASMASRLHTTPLTAGSTSKRPGPIGVCPEARAVVRLLGHGVDHLPTEVEEEDVIVAPLVEQRAQVWVPLSMRLVVAFGPIRADQRIPLRSDVPSRPKDGPNLPRNN